MTTPTADPSPRFFTIAQVAERWKCSDKTVRRLISREELVANRIRAQIRISLNDLRTYEKLHRD